MKLLLLPLLLLGAGAGGYGLLGSAQDELPETCDASDCRIEVECTERNTCIVTCFDAAGDVRCQQEVACEKPCEAPRSCSR